MLIIIEDRRRFQDDSEDERKTTLVCVCMRDWTKICFFKVRTGSRTTNRNLTVVKFIYLFRIIYLRSFRVGKNNIDPPLYV